MILSKDMIESVKRHPLLRPLVRMKARQQYQEWEKAGKPAPPPHLNKQLVLKALAREYGLSTLVETGTYMGDMMDALRNDFSRLYSIELSDEFYRKAVQRFSRTPHITIIHGDSGTKLRELIDELDGPALFWLDGHYSGGKTALGNEVSPVLCELAPIFETWDKGHVVVIDDARLFAPGSGYPLLEEVEAFVKKHRPEVRIEVIDDGIRILPSVDKR